jgi:hypothetical protein
MAKKDKLQTSIALFKALYEAKGYPPEWIEKRVRGIAIRNELTDEWDRRGAEKGLDYTILTNEISQATFDLAIIKKQTQSPLIRLYELLRIRCL